MNNQNILILQTNNSFQRLTGEYLDLENPFWWSSIPDSSLGSSSDIGSSKEIQNKSYNNMLVSDTMLFNQLISFCQEHPTDLLAHHNLAVMLLYRQKPLESIKIIFSVFNLNPGVFSPALMYSLSASFQVANFPTQALLVLTTLFNTLNSNNPSFNNQSIRLGLYLLCNFPLLLKNTPYSDKSPVISAAFNKFLATRPYLQGKFLPRHNAYAPILSNSKTLTKAPDFPSSIHSILDSNTSHLIYSVVAFSVSYTKIDPSSTFLQSPMIPDLKQKSNSSPSPHTTIPHQPQTISFFQSFFIQIKSFILCKIDQFTQKWPELTKKIKRFLFWVGVIFGVGILSMVISRLFRFFFLSRLNSNTTTGGSRSIQSGFGIPSMTPGTKSLPQQRSFGDRSHARSYQTTTQLHNQPRTSGHRGDIIFRKSRRVELAEADPQGGLLRNLNPINLGQTTRGSSRPSNLFLSTSKQGQLSDSDYERRVLEKRKRDSKLLNDWASHFK